MSNTQEIGARTVDAHRGATDSSVSRQWISRPADQRFLSMRELVEAVATRYQRCSEVDIPYASLHCEGEVQDTNSLHLAIKGERGGVLYEPTNWSFGQLCSSVRLPAEGGSCGLPATFLRALPSRIAALNINVALAMQGDSEGKMQLHDRPDGVQELRAATSVNYGRIPDAAVAMQVLDIVEQGGWKVPGVMDWHTGSYDPRTPVTIDTTTLFASDRDVWMFLVDDLHPIDVGTLPNGDPDLMFRGFIVSNSETGAAKFRLTTMYLRGVCCNRILWGVERKVTMEIRHNRLAPERFGGQALPHLEAFTGSDPMLLLQGVRAARSMVVAGDQAAQVDFLRRLNFSENVAMQIISTGRESIDGDPLTAWSMAQAITRYAQAMPYADRRFDVEQRAAKVLDEVRIQ
jgi:hypothetical protein